MLEKLNNLKKSVLVFDIETCSSYDNDDPLNTKIDINSDFETYVEKAKCKWFGCYSYKYDKYVLEEVKGNEENIKNFMAEHDVLVGFNNEEFDFPVLANNELTPEEKKFIQVDCLVTLGSSTFQKHGGLAYKNRGQLMGYTSKNNKLKSWAEAMELETQKGDIDYNIFYQDTYTEEERKDIIKYLKADVEVTKQMFDKLWDFWMPFTNFISEDNIMNLSWIRSSIASLRYKGDCHTLGVEETYGDKSDSPKEEMGGRLIEPIYEEATGVWYLDFGSLYPRIRNMFGIDNEVDMSKHWEEEHITPMGGLAEPSGKYFEGNDVFQVKGTYDVSKQSPIAIKSEKNLDMRAELKVTDPTNPLIYAIKIYENAGYGALRSEVFEQIHTPNAGWDICWLGQQIQKLSEDMMKEFGFETLYGDTDSIMVRLIEDHFVNDKQRKSYVKDCIQKILDKIYNNCPFPSKSFKIDLEYPDPLEYIMWAFSDTEISLKDVGLKKEDIMFSGISPEVINKVKKYYPDMDDVQIGNSLIKTISGKISDKPDSKINLKNEKGRLIRVYKGKKKNYLYLYKKNDELNLKIMGLPIIKINATALGAKILEDILKPKILKEKRAKFSKEWINEQLSDYLKKPEAMELLAVQYRVKPVHTYKDNKDGTPSNHICAQISRGYFEGQDGIIRLIKNKSIGKAGVTSKYCTIEEAIENNLKMEDIDLTKVKNEIEPFIERKTK